MMQLTIKIQFLKRRVFLLSLVFFTSLSIYGQIPNLMEENQVYHKFKRLKDDPIARQQFEHQMLEDPVTHQIPSNIFQREKAFMQNIHFQNARLLDLNITNGMHTPWLKRGPFNVGGRTRALAIDKTNEDIILAGGVAGGLWRSIDAGKSWTKVTTPTDRQSITCVAQDPRPHFSNVWYYGSGEIYGNSASSVGAAYRGDGIYKSTDGGVTWNTLEATSSDPTVSGGDFQYVSSIKVSEDGDVYVGHYGGVSKSINGGDTWEKVIDSPNSGFVELSIASTGKIYATLSENGFYKSDDGLVWENITPSVLDEVLINRTVLDVAPSNPNIVYFFANTPGAGKTHHMFLRYDEAQNSWVNRTDNLPEYGGYVGNLAQGSYNQYVKVKPNDENTVFIGSTNLYRSTNGFSSASQTDWIGGYAPINNVSQYENHHPDNHSMIFLPSNADVAITTHDGGISKTHNISSTEVEWEYLNNGYYTTQAYAIAIDEKTRNDARILAGFQDNGKWYTNSSAQNVDWMEEYAGGDGCYVAIVPGEHTRYTSTQYGKILRFKGDDPRSPTDSDGIQPSNASGQLFVHPYILDPNDADVMYYPASTKLWYNWNLSSINSGYTFSGTTSGWNTYDNVNTSGKISALAASTIPSDIVILGTQYGHVYRINNARSKSSSVDFISSGDGLPNAYISCVSMNPKDADHIIVVYSNYQTKSIFETKDGGHTWVHISGNLEENADGSGAGPSVRWAEFHQPENGEEGLFIGTSVGLYYAPLSQINSSTQWIQQAEETIGDAVVSMIKTREDGLVVASTHANGIFSAYYGVSAVPPLIVEQIENKNYSLGDITEAIALNEIFSSQSNNELTFSSSSSNTDIIQVNISNDTLYIETNTALGEAEIIVDAFDGDEFSRLKFKVSVSTIIPSLHAQKEANGNNYRSQFFLDFDKPIYLADDFTVPEGSVWNLSKVKAYGYSTTNNVPDVEVFIYKDNNGAPSDSLIYSSGRVATDNYELGDIEHYFNDDVTLEAGTYWITVAAVMYYSSQGSWFWKGTGDNELIGNQFYLIDPSNLFGKGYTSWTSPEGISAADVNLAFELSGVSIGNSDVEEITTINALLKPSTNIEVNWETIENVSGYKIERALNMEGPYEKVAIVNNEENSWIDGSLKTMDSTYYYKVKAFSTQGEAQNSPIASVTINTVPDPVENLEISLENTSRHLVVTWEDASEKEDGFYIEYSLNGSDGFVPLAIADRNAEKYVFTSNTLGSIEYFIRVTPFNGSGKAEAKTASIFTKLEAPDNVRYEELSPSSLLISWDDISALETGFQLEYSIDLGKTFPFSITTDVNQESIQIDNLLPGKTYYFRLKSINGFFSGQLNSNILLFVHTMTGGTKPVGVESVEAIPDFSQIEINWKDNVENELGFDVLRKSESEEEFSLIAALEYNDTTFVDTQVDQGVLYEYTVRSYNSLGESRSDTVESQLYINPPSITNLSRNEYGINLDWNDNSEFEQNYNVYKKVDDGQFELLETLIASSTTYFDTAVYENHVYSYQVSAELNGYGYFSGTEELSTVPPAPIGLTNFRVSLKEENSITISWEDSQEDEHGYKIYRRRSNERSNTLFLNLSAESRSFIDSTLVEEVNYVYTIVPYIYDVEGETLETNGALIPRVVRRPSVPFNFSIDSLQGTMDLSWSDSTLVVDNYEIYRSVNDSDLAFLVEIPSDNLFYTDHSASLDSNYVYKIRGVNESGSSMMAMVTYTAPEKEEEDNDDDEDDEDSDPDPENNPDTDDSDTDSNDDEQDSVRVIQSPSDIETSMINDYLRITWSDNSDNEQGFNIYYYDSIANEKQLIGMTTESHNVFRDRRIFTEGTYRYYIHAFNDETVSEEIMFEYEHISTTILQVYSGKVEAKIYPNPSTGIFTINLDQKWSKGVQIDIYNLSGQKVYQGNFLSNFIQLNLSHLFSGQYIIHFSDKEKTTSKVIVKN